MKNKKTKNYMVMAEDGQHEYNIKVKETDKGKKFTLFLSNGDQWANHAKGLKEITMLDTGDEVIFTPALEKLDYCQLLYVRLLVTLENKLDSNPRNREKYILIREGKKNIKI